MAELFHFLLFLKWVASSDSLKVSVLKKKLMGMFITKDAAF